MGECESILKKENNISENVSLIILKYDLKANESISKKVEYDVYNPLTRKKLKLDKCNNTNIELYIPVDMNEDLLELYKKADNQGYDIFNPENNFYNDICTPYTSINGTDIILSDRVSDILNNIGSLCEKSCDYGDVYTENKKVLCKCSTKMNSNLEITKEDFTLKKFEKIYLHLKNNLNYKVLKCYKLLFNLKSLVYNIGFYIISINIILFLILTVINFSKSGHKLKIICSKIVEDRKNYISKNLNKNDTILKNIFSFDNKKDSKILNNNNNKQKRLSKIKQQYYLEEPPKKEIKNQTNNIFFINNEQTRRKNSKKFNLIASNNIDNSNNNNDNIIAIKLNTNSKIIKNSKKINKNIKIKRKTAPSIQFNNSLIMSDNNINSKNSTNSRKSLYKRNSKFAKNSDSEGERENNFISSNISKEDIDILFNEEELNQLDYNMAIEIDKRDYITYYFSLIKQKQLLIFTFLVNKDYNIYLMKISLFLCSFVLYLMTNAFFFDNNNLHKIYKDNGKYNLFFQIPQILYSSIISSTTTVILKNLSLSQKSIIKIKKTNDIKIMTTNFISLQKCFKYKLIFFNLFGIILLAFNWYYITLFCSVYSNTQSHLLTDAFTSFCLSLIYPFGLSLIPGFLRIPALKSEKKDKFYLYRISQLIAFI